VIITNVAQKLNILLNFFYIYPLRQLDYKGSGTRRRRSAGSANDARSGRGGIWAGHDTDYPERQLLLQFYMALVGRSVTVCHKSALSTVYEPVITDSN